MNLSESLNFAVKKIVEQGDRCTDVVGDCIYGIGNKHCAIGWLLDHTDKQLMDFEGDVYELCDEFEDSIPEIIRHDRPAFSKLQAFHDQTDRAMRRIYFNDLKIMRPEVDYSGAHWEEWINMGTE